MICFIDRGSSERINYENWEITKAPIKHQAKPFFSCFWKCLNVLWFSIPSQNKQLLFARLMKPDDRLDEEDVKHTSTPELYTNDKHLQLHEDTHLYNS